MTDKNSHKRPAHVGNIVSKTFALALMAGTATGCATAPEITPDINNGESTVPTGQLATAQKEKEQFCARKDFEAYNVCIDPDEFERLIAGKNPDGSDKGAISGFFSGIYAAALGVCYPIQEIIRTPKEMACVIYEELSGAEDEDSTASHDSNAPEEP